MILTIAKCPHCSQVVAVDFHNAVLVFDPDRPKAKPCPHLVALNGFMAYSDGSDRAEFDWFRQVKVWPNWQQDWCPEEIEIQAPEELVYSCPFEFAVAAGKRTDLDDRELEQPPSARAARVRDFRVRGLVIYSQAPTRLIEWLSREEATG